MVTVAGKLKERQPEETVKILKQFFTDRGYDIQIPVNFQTEIGTWCCHIEIWKNNYKILQSNGKGMTEAFSMASGFSELYERFCNMTPIKSNIAFMKKYMEENYKKHGYYIHEGEKYDVTLKEMFTAVPAMEEFFKAMCKNKTNLEKVVESITENKLVAIPYKNIVDDNDIIYADPRLVERCNCSNGEAGGNTVQEALIQAMSEICETTASENFYLEPQEKYYVVKNECITNPDVKEKIDNIHAKGYEIYIFDLSRNFNVPVIGGVLVNPYTHTINSNFGSCPVFDIAVERVITEIYQGIMSYKTDSVIQMPSETTPPELFLTDNGNDLSGGYYFIESIFTQNKIEFVDKGSDVFVTTADSNEDLIQYFYELGKKNNFSFYYCDHSLSDEVASIEVIAPTINSKKATSKLYEKIGNIIRNDSIEFLYTMYKFINSVLNVESYSTIKGYYDYLYDNLDQIDGTLSGLLTLSSWDTVLPFLGLTFHKAANIADVGDLEKLDILQSFSPVNDYTYNRLTGLMMYINYINHGYDHEEVVRILNIFGTEFNKEDYLNRDNRDYAIVNFYIEPTVLFYNSPLYLDIVQSFIK